MNYDNEAHISLGQFFHRRLGGKAYIVAFVVVIYSISSMKPLSGMRETQQLPTQISEKTVLYNSQIFQQASSLLQDCPECSTRSQSQCRLSTSTTRHLFVPKKNPGKAPNPCEGPALKSCMTRAKSKIIRLSYFSLTLIQNHPLPN